MNPLGAVTAGALPPQVDTETMRTSPVTAPVGTGTRTDEAKTSLPLDELDRYVGPPACTVMVTVEGVLVTCPSLTTNWKVRVAGLAGAVKVGLAAVVLERVTGVPAVWVHW